MKNGAKKKHKVNQPDPVDRPLIKAPTNEPALPESIGEEFGDVLKDWMWHVVVFSGMFIFVALITALLSYGLHQIEIKFQLDHVLSTGFKHVEYAMFGLDAIFLICSIIIHTLKALKRIGTL